MRGVIHPACVVVCAVRIERCSIPLLEDSRVCSFEKFFYKIVQLGASRVYFDIILVVNNFRKYCSFHNHIRSHGQYQDNIPPLHRNEQYYVLNVYYLESHMYSTGAPNRGGGGVGGSQPPLNFGWGGWTPVNPPWFWENFF